MSALSNEIESLKTIATLTYGNGLTADEGTKNQIRQFYEMYPALGWDSYLLEFFHTYLALDIYKEDESIIAAVFGFDQNVTQSILNPDEPLTHEDGFLRFYESSLKLSGDNRMGFNFAYDITGKRPKYVYFRYSIAGVSFTSIKYRPFTNNFLEWVIQIRETKGLTYNSMFDTY